MASLAKKIDFIQGCPQVPMKSELYIEIPKNVLSGKLKQKKSWGSHVDKRS
jgi:hypothetical protein